MKKQLSLSFLILFSHCVHAMEQELHVQQALEESLCTQMPKELRSKLFATMMKDKQFQRTYGAIYHIFNFDLHEHPWPEKTPYNTLLLQNLSSNEIAIMQPLSQHLGAHAIEQYENNTLEQTIEEQAFNLLQQHLNGIADRDLEIATKALTARALDFVTNKIKILDMLWNRLTKQQKNILDQAHFTTLEQIELFNSLPNSLRSLIFDTFPSIKFVFKYVVCDTPRCKVYHLNEHTYQFDLKHIHESLFWIQ